MNKIFLIDSKFAVLIRGYIDYMETIVRAYNMEPQAINTSVQGFIMLPWDCDSL